VKVGDLVKFKGLRNSALLGIIVGFDKDNDPIVKSCKSKMCTPHWRNQVEVINEVSESR
jgi:hypothetical protein